MSDQSPRSDEPTPAVVARPLGATPHVSKWRDMKMPNISPRDALLDLMVIVGAMIVLPYVPPLVGAFEAQGQVVADMGTTLIVQKWCEAGLACALVAYFVLRHGTRPATFGLRGDRLRVQFAWALGAFAALYGALAVTVLIVAPLYLFFPELDRELSKRLEFAEALPVHNLIATLVLLVPVAIHEETLFRGLLVPYFRRLTGSWWWAGLASALIFSALHAPGQGLLAAGIQVFGIAVVLTTFFILSRSLVAVVIAHFLFDFLQLQLMRYLPTAEELRKTLEG